VKGSLVGEALPLRSKTSLKGTRRMAQGMVTTASAATQRVVGRSTSLSQSFTAFQSRPDQTISNKTF